MCARIKIEASFVPFSTFWRTIKSTLNIKYLQKQILVSWLHWHDPWQPSLTIFSRVLVSSAQHESSFLSISGIICVHCTRKRMAVKFYYFKHVDSCQLVWPDKKFCFFQSSFNSSYTAFYYTSQISFIINSASFEMIIQIVL